MLERDFQASLIRELKLRFPGCIVLKNDSGYIQGFPDLTIFYKDRYAVLECKMDYLSERQPNQEYYISYICEMGGFARFICPADKEEILYELQQTFGT